MATATKTVTPAPAKSDADARKELFAAIDALASRGGITRDRAITAWYASTLLGIDEDEAIDAATVDGPEDGGCDFIHVDQEQETIYVLQGYVSDRPERAASVRKWNALLAAVSNVKDPISFKHAGRPDIYEILLDPETVKYSMVFGLVTLAAKSDQIARQRESVTRARTYGPASFFYEHQETLYEKYLIAKTTERTVPEDTLTFSSGGLANLKGDFGQAIVGATSAGELSRWYQKYGNQLFEGNVRLFIGQRKGGINEKIIETAAHRSGEFWALNNGITVVAESFEGITERRFRLRHFSVVNGCQTTVSLSKAIEENDDAAQSQVLVRVVAARKPLLTDIVRYNNTQNPVKLAAVRLLDPIQESLRLSMQKIGYTYAPKQEGARLVRNSKRIDLDRIAQFLAAMSEDTILDAVRRKTDLFDRAYKTIFPRGLQPERVFLAWLLAQEIETERVTLLAAADAADPVMKTILGIHGTPWGIFVAKSLIDTCGSDLSKLSLQKMNTPEFRAAVSRYAKKAMELYSEIAVNIVSSGEDDANVRNEIRVRPFLEKLKRNLGLRTARATTWRLPRLHSVTS